MPHAALLGKQVSAGAVGKHSFIAWIFSNLCGLLKKLLFILLLKKKEKNRRISVQQGFAPGMVEKLHCRSKDFTRREILNDLLLQAHRCSLKQRSRLCCCTIFVLTIWLWVRTSPCWC